MSSLTNHAKPLQALTLYVGGITALYFRGPSLVIDVLNPFGVTAPYWGIMYLLASVGKLGLDNTMEFAFAKLQPARLPFRVQNPGVKGLEQLQAIDYLFLTINSFIDFIFVLNFAWFTMYSPLVVSQLSQLTILNTVGALFLLFVIDELFYVIAHGTMHTNLLYPYIHKHHHRQILPKRGYLDGANNHPIEMSIGTGAVLATVHIVARLTGAHMVALSIYQTVFAVCSLLNHTEYDISFNLLPIPGFEYSVGAHEMHHRHPKTNLGQVLMFWDKIFGTFKPYTPGATKKTE